MREASAQSGSNAADAAGEYSLVELMCIQAARETAGAGVAFVGLGLPVLTLSAAALFKGLSGLRSMLTPSSSRQRSEGLAPLV